MFAIYDKDRSGALSKSELLQIIQHFSSGPTETDLLDLVRQDLGRGKRRTEDVYVFSDYLKHVETNGENAVVLEFRRRMIDP